MANGEKVGHTKGPWAQHSKDATMIISTQAVTSDRTNPTVRPVHVAQVWGPAGPLDAVIAEHLANARLIAAAPELLKALKLALDALDSLESDGVTIRPQEEKARELSRSAITKAEGKQL